MNWEAITFRVIFIIQFPVIYDEFCHFYVLQPFNEVEYLQVKLPDFQASTHLRMEMLVVSSPAPPQVRLMAIFTSLVI